MLMLVTANNLLQMFFGWEGVGLASYLLIGFWFRKPSANAAAIKAFVVNRVGDLGFMLGIFGTYLVFNTIDPRNPGRGRRPWRDRPSGSSATASTR
jgi:NADH-quinone oxidoreductase subunit L